MNTNTQHNTKYKNSPLGLIPEDWEVKTLKEVCLKIQDGNYGGDYPKVDEFIDFGIPFLTSKAIGGSGELIIKKVDYISEEKHKKLKKAHLKLNDVLFTNRGANVGTIGMVDNRIAHGNIGPQLTLLRSNSEKIHFDYLKAAMKSFLVQNQVKSQDSGSAMNFFGIADTSKFKLCIPILSEQKAIADCLSTWDKAIEKLNALIAQKELSKKALMQQLLSGKKRLKGFGGEWEIKRVGDVFEYIKTYSISRDGLTKERNGSSIYCIHYGDIHALYENDFLDFNSQQRIPQIIDSSYSINEKDYLKEGDIIMADASEDYAGVGEIVEVVNLNNAKAVGGLHTIILRGNSKSICNIFRGYIFSSEPVRNSLRKMATGTSVYSVTKTTLNNLMIKFPRSLEEQNAIANVLQCADDELQLLKKKLDQLKEQKKGLMQVLLTGKKRLNY